MTDSRSDQSAWDASPTPVPAPAEGALAGPTSPDWVAWLIAFAAFAAYSVISVSYIVRLAPGSTDLAVFTEYVKQYAHLNAPIVDVRSPGLNLLGDHFHPIVALIAPFFLAAPTPVTLVLAQALLVALSVIPVNRAAAAKLGRTPARIITAAYALSWGLQQMIDFDFHELAFAVPLLACSLSALARGKTRAAVLWALPLVFVKEDQGFTVAAIGLIMLITAWRARARGARDDVASSAANPPPNTWTIRAGLFLVVWGLAWSALSIEVIIPFFNPAHQYDYWSAGGILGDSSSNSAIALLDQIGHDYLRKLGTLALVLVPVVFLALRSPLSLVAVPILLLRFINTDPNYWGPYYHYSAPLMPIVFVAAIDGLSRIQAARSTGPAPERRDAAAIVRYSPALMLAIALGLCFWAPVKHLFQSQTYTVSQHVRAENAAMAKVPDGATVEATQSMEAPLAARTDVFYARDPGNPAPEYIAIDSTDYYAQPPIGGNIGQWVKRDHPHASYQQIYSRDHVYIFRRK
ncbi:MAG TPA: DUF2079 domain-containing protein [Streptosporangiaceae bacterium]|jgi:uncharacterized membrane protein